MSIKVTGWALNEAPVEQPVQVLILVAMAERCNDDGTCSYQSVKTIASKARISPRTVHREFKNLEAMGVIRRGDQAAAEHLPVNRRPVVYDLAVELRRGDNLSYQDSGVTEESVQEESGVTSTTVRGDTDDSLGVTPMADNSSFITSPLTTKEKETSVLNSPELPTLNLPDWCPRETRWITDAMALCESRGLDFETTLWNYTNSGYFGGETPNPQRYLTNWLLVEVDCRKKGKPLPGQETLAVDTPESLEQAFEMFWDAYPKKEQRKIAEAAFKWAVTQADAALIIKQAKGFKRKCDEEKTEHNFIPAPHNWLKASRWTDVYPSGFKSINHTGDV